MSSSRQTIHSVHNKKFWTEFFYLYESLPALWDMKNSLYKNRQVKNDAYDIMVDKLREIEPSAEREDVLRKINIFRTNFRRECSRINMSLQEGKNYQSTLWYFDMLSFLQTSDTRRDRKRKIDNDGEKSIMRKRRNNILTRKSTDEFIIASKKDNLIEYQPHSTHEFEYDLDGEPDFDYVPDELEHNLVDGKNDTSSEVETNNLSLSNYQGTEEENDDDELSQEEYTNDGEYRNYRLPRTLQINNKKIKLSASNVSELDGEISTNKNPLEIRNESESRQVFPNYANDNISALQLDKVSLHLGTTATNKATDLNDNTATKFVRDVKTMTLNNSHNNCCATLSESSEILAKSWAVQYAELSQDQKVLARKAINDILFEGCMNNLSMGSNGRVTIGGTIYKTHPATKVSSKEEVESSGIYKQSTTNKTLSASLNSTVGAGTAPNSKSSLASSHKQHASGEWLDL